MLSTKKYGYILFCNVIYKSYTQFLCFTISNLCKTSYTNLIKVETEINL